MSQAAALGGLRTRVLRASGWSLLGQVGAQVIRFGGSLVMTRLLMPELFGVMSLAMMFIVALNLFSDLGLSQVVMRHPVADDKPFLDTVWTTQIMRSAMICAAGLVIATALLLMRHAGWLPAGSAYAHPDLPTALYVISFVAIINGLESTKVFTSMRTLALGPLALMEFASQVAGLGATVAWAMVSPTIFAVTGGAIAAALARTAISHAMLEGVPNRLHWSRESFEEIVSFGRWVFVSSILGFLISNGDRMLLGGLLDAREFGVYAIAALIVGAVSELGARLFNAVVYPALNETYRENPQRLRDTYYRLRGPVEFVCCAAAGIMVVAGPAIIHFLYDERYAQAGLAVQIMSVPMVFLGLNSASSLYMVIGKPWITTALTAVRLVALYAAVPVLAWRYGLPGGAAGVVISHVATVPALYFMKARSGFLSVRHELLALPALLAGATLGYGLTWLLPLIHRH